MSALFKRLVKVQREDDAYTLSENEFHMLTIDYTMTICTSIICSITQLLGMTTNMYAN